MLIFLMEYLGRRHCCAACYGKNALQHWSPVEHKSSLYSCIVSLTVAIKATTDWTQFLRSKMFQNHNFYFQSCILFAMPASVSVKVQWLRKDCTKEGCEACKSFTNFVSVLCNVSMDQSCCKILYDVIFERAIKILLIIVNSSYLPTYLTTFLPK